MSDARQAAEAMREAAAKVAYKSADNFLFDCSAAILALPLPEATPMPNARDVAIAILSNCAMQYVEGNSQKSIDRSIEMAVSILTGDPPPPAGPPNPPDPAADFYAAAERRVARARTIPELFDAALGRPSVDLAAACADPRDIALAKAREALSEMIYESTHLSALDGFGNHSCWISARSLAASREALAAIDGAKHE